MASDMENERRDASSWIVVSWGNAWYYSLSAEQIHIQAWVIKERIFPCYYSFSRAYKNTSCPHLVIRDGTLFHCRGINVLGNLGSSGTEFSLARLLLSGWDGHCSQKHASTVRHAQRNTILLIHSQTISWIGTKNNRRKWLWITKELSGDGRRTPGGTFPVTVHSPSHTHLYLDVWPLISQMILGSWRQPRYH